MHLRVVLTFDTSTNGNKIIHGKAIIYNKRSIDHTSWHLAKPELTVKTVQCIASYFTGTVPCWPTGSIKQSRAKSNNKTNSIAHLHIPHQLSHHQVVHSSHLRRWGVLGCWQRPCSKLCRHAGKDECWVLKSLLQLSNRTQSNVC